MFVLEAFVSVTVLAAIGAYIITIAKYVEQEAGDGR